MTCISHYIWIFITIITKYIILCVIAIWMNKQSCKFLWYAFDPRYFAWVKNQPIDKIILFTYIIADFFVCYELSFLAHNILVLERGHIASDECMPIHILTHNAYCTRNIVLCNVRHRPTSVPCPQILQYPPLKTQVIVPPWSIRHKISHCVRCRNMW